MRPTDGKHRAGPLGADPPSELAGWDRRSGLDRRRGRRRLKLTPVLFNQRAETDRRHIGRRRIHKLLDLPHRNQRSSLVEAILNHPILRHTPRIHRRRTRRKARDRTIQVLKIEGVVASVYSAWEPRPPMGDGARYREIEGVIHRQLGTAGRVSGRRPPQEGQARECRRAYDAIYAAHPALRTSGLERGGEVVEPAF